MQNCGAAIGDLDVLRSDELLVAERARLLAELSTALGEARRLVKELGASEGRFDAVELYAGIEALRFEVEAMRLRRRRADRENSPEWTNLAWEGLRERRVNAARD